MTKDNLDDILVIHSPLDCIEIERRYLNNNRYAEYEFEDETSQFDPLGKWMGGLEYYSRTYRVRVPKKMLEKANESGDHSAIMRWIDNHGDRGIWL
jgi:hypothetical protein